jgi:endonuclease V-like protein UPF0215 family
MPLVGVEDGSFQKGVTKRAILAAVLLRGIEIENAKITNITVDGLDATERLIGILIGWEFAAVLLAGVSFAGFNLIDPTVVYESFQKPVIVVLRKKPNNKMVKRALQKHFEDWDVRWRIFEKLGVAKRVIAVTGQTLYIEPVGIDFVEAQNLVKALAICSKIPEPLRVARLIARGLS